MKSITTGVAFAASLALTGVALAAGPAGKAPAKEHHHDSGGIGEAGKATRIDRTVAVDMSDSMRFSPARISVRQGETVRFVIHNGGQLKHEMVLGTAHELREHYELMKKFPEMEHDEPQMVTVAPGKTGEIVWRFTKNGKVDFACLQPGHYDAGMKGLVTVASAKGATGKGPGAAKHNP